MGEPRLLRPHVAAAELGAQWWETTVRTVRATPRDAVDVTVLYDLAAEVVTTLRALEDLADLLARAAESYAERPDLRDDEGADPRIRLRHAARDARATGRLLRETQQPVNAFWSAVGHIGLQRDPEQHNSEQHDSEQEDPVRGHDQEGGRQ